MSSGPGKQRLDMLLVDRGLAPSREKAQRMIMAGEVWSGTKRLTKPGVKVGSDLEVDVRGGNQDVGRGALKLRAALERFPVDPGGRVAVDLGASTGGFTQVLLEAGARRVHAVDVGHGQLDVRLRNDPRVVVHEGVNARHLTANEIGDPFDLVVADLSFISLKLVLPPALGLVSDARARGDAIVLMKPQFEAGRKLVGRGGIVRDRRVHQALLEEFRAWLPAPGWHHAGDVPSPIEGAQGNREFLIHYKLGERERAG